MQVRIPFIVLEERNKMSKWMKIRVGNIRFQSITMQKMYIFDIYAIYNVYAIYTICYIFAIYMLYIC